MTGEQPEAGTVEPLKRADYGSASGGLPVTLDRRGSDGGVTTVLPAGAVVSASAFVGRDRRFSRAYGFAALLGRR